MRKRSTAVVLVLFLALVLCACKKNSGNLVTGYKTGDVTLGQYRGIEYTPISKDVTESDIQAKIDSFLNGNKIKNEITDREDVQSGDVANIDFTGYMNGETFEGGTAQAYDLTIGSGGFIAGFEDGLIGVRKGETVDLQLKFPDPYQNNPDFSGKDVTFTVTVNGIYTMVTPELTDELIAEKTDYDTIADYRKSVEDQLKKQRENEAENDKQNKVAQAVIANATFVKDLTEDINKERDAIIENENANCQQMYGVDAVTLYSAIYGMNEETFTEFMRSQAEFSVRFRFIASAIAESEKITCTEDEISAFVQDMLSNTGASSADELYARIKSVYNVEGKDYVAEQVKLNKAADIIFDSAVAVAEVPQTE